jgi:mRNA interferase RelE/StbE
VFRLLYHPAVATDDLPQILRNLQIRIAGAIEQRLAASPEKAGTPLRGTLKGYWKLCAGDHRVVYAVRGTDVWVLAIRHRATVYTDVPERHVDIEAITHRRSGGSAGR